MPPIALTDNQLDMVTLAAAPLHPNQRGAFLQLVATALRGRVIGDGLVARVCAEPQSRFFAAARRRGEAGAAANEAARPT
jgi:hypothetical protein